ncbi:MAG: endo alpha-1,4 polygalactosaminidase [Chloroflexi bacterium]|nr:endo alpha-1,4 polygalactosaminidase [Chloroflexota bacterium]
MKLRKFLARSLLQKSAVLLAAWLVVLFATASCDSTDNGESIGTIGESTVGQATPGISISGPPDSDWNWQLTGQLDTSVDAEVWDVDLFDTAPDEISRLHNDGRYVICYFSAGTIESWRPDVNDVDESTIGLPLDDWEGERWLDIRAESVLELAKSRLRLAERSNCDAVEPDNVDGYSNETGFPLSQSDQVRFNTQLARAAHERGLAVGLKNAFELMSTLSSEFDFAITEQCHEFDECDLTNPFTENGKPVFNAEYPADRAIGSTLQDEYCAEANRLGIHTLILPVELDGSWRISCG